MKKLLITLLLFPALISCAQDAPKQVSPVQQEAAVNSDATIQWMSFEEAVAKSKLEPKKMFIDVYTHWCGWCKKMDASTFKDPAIVKYMNDKYYAVKLDAETHDTIHFFDKTFIYKAENKTNEIAISLLNGQMSYPSFVFLDEKFNMLSPLAGYQQADQLMRVLVYFGDNIYSVKKWDDYAKEAAEGK
jgi:thioredoxin-related protein